MSREERKKQIKKMREKMGIRQDVETDDFGIPIYWNYDDRAVKLVQKNGRSKYVTRDGKSTIGMIALFAEGTPLSKKEFETMHDPIEEAIKKRDALIKSGKITPRQKFELEL